MDNVSKEIMKEQEAKEMSDKIKKISDIGIMEELLKSNQIIFKHNDNEYRVRFLNLAEKEELNQLRMREFARLMKDENILTENDYREIYKKRGIGLSEIESSIRKNDLEKFGIQLKLGEAISNKASETVLEEYKKNIEAIEEKLRLLTIQRGDLLQYSLENLLAVFVMHAMTYLSLDIKKGDSWERLFKTFEDFKNEQEDELITKAAYRSFLLQNV